MEPRSEAAMRGHRRLHLTGPAPFAPPSRQRLAERILDAQFGRETLGHLLRSAAEGAAVDPAAPACRPFARFIETAQQRARAAFAQAIPEDALRQLAALRGTAMGRMLFETLPNVACFTDPKAWEGAPRETREDGPLINALAEVLQGRLLRPEAQMAVEPLLHAAAVWGDGGGSIARRWATLVLDSAPSQAQAARDVVTFLRSPLGRQYAHAIMKANQVFAPSAWCEEFHDKAKSLVEGLQDRG